MKKHLWLFIMMISALGIVSCNIDGSDGYKQVVVGKIDFSGGNESMYEKFIHEMQENELNQKLNSYLYFDDNSYTVWMMW